MSKALKEAVETILNENENAASLKAKSKSADETKRLPGEVVDHGEAINDRDGEKKDFAKSVKKSKEPGQEPPVGAEPMKKLSEEEKIEDESGEEETPEFKFEFDVSEDIKAMFSGSDLSEEFMNNAKGIYETALRANLKKYAAVLDEQFDKTVEKAIEINTEKMDEKVGKYLQHVAEEWLVENEVAIESTLRTELTEDFVTGLRNLFLENYIDLPEDKVDVVEQMAEELEVTKSKLDEEIAKTIELKEQLVEAHKSNVINDMTEGMVATQAEKIKSLAEEVEFTSLEEFKDKVNNLIESYYPKTPVKKDKSMIAEVSDNPEEPVVTENVTRDMEKYLKAANRFSR